MMTKDESTKSRFCYIDDEYLNYLRNPGDDKVPENEYETSWADWIKCIDIYTAKERFGVLFFCLIFFYVLCWHNLCWKI